MRRAATTMAGAVRRARILLAAAVGLLVLIGPVTAQQPPRTYKIGYLTISPRDMQLHLIAAFERGLGERGYVIGRDIVIEYRFADGKPERLPSLADELVRARVDVIVTGINPNVRAAQQATAKIPIVVANAYFPVEDGLVQSLRRPGGNVTGLTTDAADEITRRLQLLREALPGTSRVAVLHGTGEDYMKVALRKLHEAGRKLGVTVVPMELRGPEDVERAFADIKARNVQAVLGIGVGAFANRASIIGRANAMKLPTAFPDKRQVDEGALLSYGVDLSDLFYRAAFYVDRILKGAHPADMPFEQPTKYVLAINLKAARGLGITIPQTLLLQADHIVTE